MYHLLNRLGQEGLEPLLQHLESFIKQSGLDDMKACVEIIVTVCFTRYSCAVWLLLYMHSRDIHKASCGTES